MWVSRIVLKRIAVQCIERFSKRIAFHNPFMQRHIMKHSLLLAALGMAIPLAAAPLQVYLMAGQSNLQGFCGVHTLPQIEADPKTAPILKKMVNQDDTPRVHEKVWIFTSGYAKDATPGQLTTGYGGGKGDRIGPELTFGIYLQEHPEEWKLMETGVSNAFVH